ncbi:hypothetical protein SBOR_5140 [Sclerotinia borealis F-4128]|uniref:F-box domain-containing protein n=1 Tax=Sclerotinia borealis (strain F-4128) TaxID=1432307 RepID=W9CCL0_SCLBF|nr:hypothetical protein SBOR_5140 [Sclerotinia borealis F-4128]
MGDMEPDLKGSACAMHDDQVYFANDAKVKDADSRFVLDADIFEQQARLSAVQDSEQASINTIPPELIDKIMGHLTPCMRACLGVTCRRMYKTFKYVHPELVNLAERPVMGAALINEVCLSSLIEIWMGPQYRRGVMIPQHYLLRTVYGDLPRSQKERDLEGKYLDYWRSRTGKAFVHGKKRSLMCFFVYRLPLPSPFNRGDMWEDEAVAVIEQNLINCFSTRTWTSHWENFWIWRKHSTHFAHIGTLRSERQAEIILSDGYFTDWIDMVGF